MQKGIFIPEDAKRDVEICVLDEPLYMSLGHVVGGFFEIVNIREFNNIKKLKLIVNDCGAINGMELNFRASILAEQAIYGPAILMKEEFTEEGPDIVGLTNEEIKTFQSEC